MTYTVSFFFGNLTKVQSELETYLNGLTGATIDAIEMCRYGNMNVIVMVVVHT